jgi:hypothetical protein
MEYSVEVQTQESEDTVVLVWLTLECTDSATLG